MILQLTPQALKPAVAQALVDLTAPIRAAFEKSKEWQEITLKAYPPPEKKVKKVKDKGNRYPGRPKPAVDGQQTEDAAVATPAELASAGTESKA